MQAVEGSGSYPIDPVFLAETFDSDGGGSLFHDHRIPVAGLVLSQLGPDMIIERIKAISIIPPKVILTKVPIGRISHEVETTHTVGSGERQISEGATGAVLEVSYSDIEVGFYSPRDLIVFAQQSKVVPR